MKFTLSKLWRMTLFSATPRRRPRASVIRKRKIRHARTGILIGTIAPTAVIKKRRTHPDKPESVRIEF